MINWLRKYVWFLDRRRNPPDTETMSRERHDDPPLAAVDDDPELTARVAQNVLPKVYDDSKSDFEIVRDGVREMWDQDEAAFAEYRRRRDIRQGRKPR